MDGETWLITGCSTGLGRALAERLIGLGKRVFATAREPESLDALVRNHVNATALGLDVTSPEQVRAAVAVVERAGGVDVLVNNAGYGYLAALEEGEDARIRALFETNMFGLIAMTQAVLPGMRERRHGHIINIASVGGLVGNPGSAFYAATKFGVVGLSEALSREVAPLGIRVTVVEPGPFRTDWSGRALDASPDRIPAYAQTVHERIGQLARDHGRERGDPDRAAVAIIRAVGSEQPPLNLILGGLAIDIVREKQARLAAEINAWESLSRSTDSEDSEAGRPGGAG